MSTIESGTDTGDAPPPGVNRREMLRRTALAGALASTPALLAACGSSDKSTAAGGGGSGVFADHPKWKFVFVNHVTTNPFFIPTRYGGRGRLQAVRLRLPVDRVG